MYAKLLLLVLQGAATYAADPIKFTSEGNPILADGSYYSADPAPLVVNNTLYIIAGHDEAPVEENSFVINEWELFVGENPKPSGSEWTLHPGFAKPHEIFKWAAEGTAYAAQIVQGPDGKFYLYAPVTEANSQNTDPFAIGVAVADSPLGPYTDAHPDGPILSQSVPAPGNDIQNIDPTVLVDGEKVYVYYGTFNQLRGYELDTDMVTTKGDVVTVDSLTGFFEAPWIMKRKDTYYMLYAANNAGADSPCTPTSYHACIAYGTASSPLGPWTFGDVILGLVSSTTSHSGAVELDGEWYMIYHTADAEGGGHFRRSVAFDKLTFDDSQSPPAINKVVQTKRPDPDAKPTRNIAPKATASSENETPIQYWVESLHDEKIPSNPLPPDYWSSYDGDNSPETSTLTYEWNSTVTLNGVRMAFFADQAAGATEGVPPPADWHVEYQTDAGSWEKVDASDYPLEVTDDPEEVSFTEVKTSALRAILTASGSGGKFGGVAVKEWEALAPTAQ
ncbi:glycoside hydrolase family 43 protein [Aplosporella prunicola CBS 121167]|uniref:Glycoside hydrolase family 43 protein n=1 Tax=Aplosporella prunicola CBS 121167 TaxID=1176127 RepID=A0A6A6BEG0_9PEZI|nr:glycoside hydrolase family 43 protein [Aplosporella prunicola CBS 121167]KAF2141918.1 glycoside hydrolase family 43 protein [Aplosporella prunicola CBS 121167]